MSVTRCGESGTLRAVAGRHEECSPPRMPRQARSDWTISRQHTGLTDLPLTGAGEAEAVHLAERLAGRSFAAVFTSPLRRAMRTCEQAGYRPIAVVEPDLIEWNYGAYEGRTTREIHADRPGWNLFRDGCPYGETPEAVGVRADRIIRRVRAIDGDVLLFSSGHFLQVFAARWLELEPRAGKYFVLGTASLSELGYEHDGSEPVIRLWDETHHECCVARHHARARETA
jgi:broad specificity phosphatase PhoE